MICRPYNELVVLGYFVGSTESAEFIRKQFCVFAVKIICCNCSASPAGKRNRRGRFRVYYDNAKDGGKSV